MKHRKVWQLLLTILLMGVLRRKKREKHPGR